MSTVNICETFISIQGETTYAGIRCFFIRLSECNLRCKYCDTVYAYDIGKTVESDKLIADAIETTAPLVMITGGEPLLQQGFKDLAIKLCEIPGTTVLVETNGSLDISVIPAKAVAIVDVKCPGSGEAGSFDEWNIGRLRPHDEVKFVLCDRGDYDWACEFVKRTNLTQHCKSILFSPVSSMLNTGILAQWIIDDGVNVRLQPQLHKVMGVR
ncbi:MAG: radical SAM protein [Lentisphaerae bacterium]|nr:radical SAM protein [Lentisphaerota bacterium]